MNKLSGHGKDHHLRRVVLQHSPRRKCYVTLSFVIDGNHRMKLNHHDSYEQLTGVLILLNQFVSPESTIELQVPEHIDPGLLRILHLS
jgi:hypothetical protein